jgi:hypothetical protein
MGPGGAVRRKTIHKMSRDTIPLMQKQFQETSGLILKKSLFVVQYSVLINYTQF